MTPRKRRFAFGIVGMIGLGIALALLLDAFESNLVFFFTPSDIVAGKAPRDTTVTRSAKSVTTNCTVRPSSSRCRLPVSTMPPIRRRIHAPCLISACKQTVAAGRCTPPRRGFIGLRAS